MRLKIILTIAIVISGLLGVKSFSLHKQDKTMILNSQNFNHNQFIPKRFTCQGKNINPQLSWNHVPEGTQSFALTVKDPDAPGQTFVHWMVYNIDKETRRIAVNSVPGRQLTNSFGKKDYGGPCPPSGTHRYYFRLYALDVKDLGEISSKAHFFKKIKEHKIARAVLMGKYTKE